MGSDVLAMIDGHWDQEIYIKDRALDKVSVAAKAESAHEGVH